MGPRMATAMAVLWRIGGVGREARDWGGWSCSWVEGGCCWSEGDAILAVGFVEIARVGEVVWRVGIDGFLVGFLLSRR